MRRRLPVIELLYVLAIVVGFAAARLAARYGPPAARQRAYEPVDLAEPRTADPSPTPLPKQGSGGKALPEPTPHSAASPRSQRPDRTGATHDGLQDARESNWASK
jgi:hypothetical protein